MVDRRRIIELWRSGRASALVTLVRVEGSSYRRTGARLLIAANGEYVGSISGGCLEAEVVRKARWVVQGGAMVERFSTLFDDTAEVPYGLGCGGVVDLLMEPTGTPEFEALMLAMEASLRGEYRRVATQMPDAGAPLLRCVMDEHGRHMFRSKVGMVDAAESVFAEELGVPQRLVVCGAGDDAQPMVRMAALLGWDVVVLDGRSQWAQARRFPEAQRVVAGVECEGFAIRAQDAVVVMSHSYEQDGNWLQRALPASPRYLGLLGSRHRSALLVAEAAAKLGWTVERACDGLFAPVGMDLGGDGAEAIALSVIAEVQGCVEGKFGRSRRMTAQVVDEQIAKGGASMYLQTQCAL